MPGALSFASRPRRQVQSRLAKHCMRSTPSVRELLLSAPIRSLGFCHAMPDVRWTVSKAPEHTGEPRSRCAPGAHRPGPLRMPYTP